MSPPVFYFGAISPYSWFAAERIEELIPDALWRPVFAGGLFRSAGRESWGITDSRAARTIECEERALGYDLGRIRWPDGWPGNDVLTARSLVAAEAEGALVPAALRVMRACFRDGRDVTQAEVLIDLLGADVVAAATSDPVKARLRSINDEAVAAGVIGVPSVVVDGSVFWGDDRLAEAAAAIR